MYLGAIRWFESIGTAIDTNFGIPYRLVDEKQCLKSINSIKWENFVLYAINNLHCYIDTFHREEVIHWNDHVKKFNVEFDVYKDLIQEKATLKNVPGDIFIDLKGVVCMAAMERYYTGKLGPAIPVQFETLMNVYSSGHIPCGWDGPQPKNEGYEAVDFSKGKILIW
ncbi:hypothetical protein [Chitinophaga arvensicola]|uniref:Uncharacterized protein n=1 Tax=Chitinophaga arvensicola TaxID=29529 RepID=A0A1I0S9P1_9BACT|nr:hypothetical protein [Chitinophaga arvensicola]SEW52895.1 hypothetical protein SAMN04488122_5217 [Chitinophaga arvensicola]